MNAAARGLDELVNTKEPGIELVRGFMANAVRPVEVLSADRAAGESTLLDLQVTTRSPMGAIAYETGGLLVDDGWVRVLGAGCDRMLRSVTSWNRLTHGGPAAETGALVPGAIVVGDDVLGGAFAVSGGGLPVPPSKVGYLAPDTLAWESLDMSYSEWLWWLFTGDLDGFYEGMRWPGWRDEVQRLSGDEAFTIYPFLSASGPPIAERTRSVVPLRSLWALHDRLAAFLGPNDSNG